MVTPDSQLITAVLRGDAAQAEACLHSGANPRRPREDGLDALRLGGRVGGLGAEHLAPGRGAPSPAHLLPALRLQRLALGATAEVC